MATIQQILTDFQNKDLTIISDGLSKRLGINVVVTASNSIEGAIYVSFESDASYHFVNQLELGWFLWGWEAHIQHIKNKSKRIETCNN